MKNSGIQILRAIFAAMVVLIHTLPNNYEIKAIVRPFLNVAVAGFIFLSGYLTKVDIDTKAFYKKRIINVLVPYVLFTIIYTVLSNYELGVGAIAIKVFKNLITAQGKMILYYLPVYMQLVLLTPLLAKIAKRKKPAINIIIMAISPLFILCFYLGVLSGVIYKEMPWYMMFFPVWLSYYYLGLLIGNKLHIIKASSKRLIVLIAIGLILQIAEGIFWLHNTSVKDMYFSQIRFTSYIQNIPTLLLIARYISSNGKRNRRILVKIGDASFGIYLLHPAFIMVCDKIITRTEATFVITFVVAFAGSFATVLVLNKIVPRKALKYTGLAIK